MLMILHNEKKISEFLEIKKGSTYYPQKIDHILALEKLWENDDFENRPKKRFNFYNHHLNKLYNKFICFFFHLKKFVLNSYLRIELNLKYY
ncbi:hypothetical protein BpHYR1_037111 [Brachionus plicatilis]|uniref:Uncharacterized protein n=1 Tax=Brachionus plicatilis TaxID=10195 RepID=A0A3M7SSN3_BRAPC|nr:hypothetical protein BpHYR1_037111 [Brachionus plicatilis]